jgi:haloalkane dehalogenase
MEPGHPSRPTLEAIEAGLPALANHPILMFWGGRDFCFDDSFLARWRSIYPRASVLRQPDAGHYVLEDSGADARRRIADFLAS